MKSSHILFTLFCSIVTVFTAVGMKQSVMPQRIEDLASELKTFISETPDSFFDAFFAGIRTISDQPQVPSALPIKQKQKKHKPTPKPKPKQVKPKETPKQRKQREKKEEENRLLAAAKAETQEARKKMGGGTPAATSAPRSLAQRDLLQKRLQQLKAARGKKERTISYVYGRTPEDSTIHAGYFAHHRHDAITGNSTTKTLIAKHREVNCPGIEITQDFLEEWTRLKNQHPHNPLRVLKELMAAKRPCCPQ